MKKILPVLLVTLMLSNAAFAENPLKEGTFTTPGSDTLDLRGEHKIALGMAEDYGLGVTLQLNHLVDLSLGHAGVGADFIFFRYAFMPRSKFFSKRPLDFYVGGGLGYVWDSGFAGMREGLILRTPVGAEWKFHKKWAAYLSAAPAINFQNEQKSNGVVTVDSGPELIVMGTVGIRYLF